MGPLNPDLYHRLLDRLGEVVIHNEGCETTRIGDMIIADGERYVADCLFCYGSKKLGISYEWGTFDRERDTCNWGRAICYKSGCLEEPANFEELRRLIYTFSGLTTIRARMRRSQLRRGVPALPWTGNPVEPPSNCIPLRGMSKDSPVHQYLAGRNFNPAELNDIYGVQYCVDVDCGLYPTADRIIVPVRRDGMTIAWQGRKIGDEDDGRPKYFNSPGSWKSQVLYGLDDAKGHDFVVVVEGVTDVWRIGRPAVATLGKKPAEVVRR